MTDPIDSSIKYRHLVEIVAVLPGVAEALLTNHLPAPESQRCRACTVPGTGLPGAPWPCPMQRLADAALVYRERRS